MGTDTVNVQPYDIVNTTTVNSFNVSVMSLDLFNSVTLTVDLFDASGNRVSAQRIILSGDDYIAWGSDDNYINRYVATQLGATIIN
jgi:hypothetical protein